VLHVLLVEDSDADAELVRDALSECVDADILLTRVERLQNAKERLEKERFDVVLLDLSLPDAMGFDGLHCLREAAPGAPIVVLTGLLDSAAGTHALQQGAQDFLQKGQVGGSELLRAIRYARERQQYTDRTRLLAEVNAALASSLDPPAMLASLVESVAQGFADRCAVDGLHDIDWLTGPDAVIAAPPGTSRLYPSLESAPGEPSDRGRIEALRDPTVRSAMVVPFVVDGQESGALVLGRLDESHPYGPADLALAEEIARRAVNALEHIGLLGARRERARAEVASRLKDEFLATLSHELRTPLTAILGWTRMLRIGGLAPDKQARALDTIERNARSQVALIEDVLDVSRIIAGKVRLEVCTVEMAQALNAAVETVRPTADAKGVHLEVTYYPDPGTIQGDPDRLQQVLWNLLSNAVKFTPRGGRVSVRITRAESFLEIIVVDDGQGIGTDFLPHVFERFRQADASMTRAHGGLGLGLAIVRHLVELHGGTIRVESAGAGKGATFIVRLPVSAPLVEPTSKPQDVLLPPEPELAQVRPPSLAGTKVLIVDDEPDMLGFLQMALEHRGAMVTTASSPREAIAALRASPPDVLISDVGMPGETGYDLVRWVRELPAAEGGLTPAIALTAYTGAEDRMRALTTGFDYHMGKPFEPDELFAVIANLAKRIPHV
jgi:signal transduction histidine kinase/DNA-binding response OmpR family regulator